ncbi:unnamed protein product [Lactuca virosa]|uniref:Uncharacterized protein n=1 Tax=Lactuca virosa TaxID=75947 RepID=A0AAU9LGA9_9ASTR|nr:unnamed protein product [Lactuca virosa]
MSFARLYARSSQLSSLCKTLNRTPVNSRSLLEAGQRRYSFVGASSSKHNQFSSEFRNFTSRSAHNTNSFNKSSHLGNGYFKTPLGSHRQYVTNVIREQKSRKMLYYLTGLVFAMVGCTYAAVPLYRRFCQATGYGGTVQRRETVEEKIARHSQDGTVTNREIVVHFNADVSDGMPWKFIPTQREVRVKPGESALAFYTAENRSSTPITGMSTYNVTPMKAAVYFNKIQCFCFEEQRLLPGEQIDMPVFFYIDPEFETDPRMDVMQTLCILMFMDAKVIENKYDQLIYLCILCINELYLLHLKGTNLLHYAHLEL